MDVQLLLRRAVEARIEVWDHPVIEERDGAAAEVGLMLQQVVRQQLPDAIPPYASLDGVRELSAEINGDKRLYILGAFNLLRGNRDAMLPLEAELNAMPGAAFTVSVGGAASIFDVPTKGLRYPADPPKVEEIIAVMRAAGDRSHGRRLRGLIVVLWRAGLRRQEALALTEGDLDQRRGALLVRRGKGGRRREVGMDAWGFEQLEPWLETRRELPVGPLLCVINGASRGRHWSSAAARAELRRTAASAGVRRRFAPHQLRHAHAVEIAREGVPLVAIQRQLGHSNLGITSVYLQGIDSGEIIETVHTRRAPMIPVSASLRL